MNKISGMFRPKRFNRNFKDEVRIVTMSKGIDSRFLVQGVGNYVGGCLWSHRELELLQMSTKPSGKLEYF